MTRPLTLILAAATAMLGACATAPQMSSAEAESLFRLRHDTLIREQNFPPRLYQPSERAPGRPLARPDAVAAQPIPDAAWAQVQAYAQATNTRALMVAHRGRIVRSAWFGTEPEAEQISRSLHKMIVALLIGRAIHDGHIKGLDQSVADFIPAWRGTPKAAVTINDLLRMQSGLDWYTQSADPESLFQRAYLDPFGERVIIERWPLVAPPGTAYDYSNVNSELLGLIVQRATGMRYADYLSRALLIPAGAPDAQVWVNRPGGAPKSGCCLLAPAETYLRVGMWLLDQQKGRGPRLLPTWWFEEYLRPSPHKPELGLSVWLGDPWIERRLFARESVRQPGVFHSEPYAARGVYVFDGADARILWIIPSHDLVVLRLGDPPPRDGPRWDNALIPNALIRALEAQP